MMRSLKGSILALLGMGVLLAGCDADGISSLANFDVDVGFSPTSVGFEVDDEGKITVPSHVVTFSSAPGSVGGVATGFDVVYYEQDGTTYFLTGTPTEEQEQEDADREASTFTSRGALAHPIPAGLECVGENPSVPCRVTSPDAVLRRVQSDPVSNVITLPGLLAREILDRAGEVGTDPAGAAGVAEFTFYATTDNGVEVEIPAVVLFTYPVGEGGE
jgi:hypothetical protein